MKKYFALLAGLFVFGFAFALEQTEPAPVRNVIWVIGDGMGPELMGFLMQGVRAGALADYPDKTCTLEQFINEGEQGFFFNHTHDTVVTDSAAAATQMATGQWSLPGRIGIDYQGKPAVTLLELAKQKGKSIGIISDTYVTDATPAGFTAHTDSRRNKMEIARQQIQLGVDVILGGGKQYFSTGENKDLLTAANEQGYRVVQDKKALTKVRTGKLLGLFADKALPMAVEMHAHPKVPTLALQTQKALEILSQNPEGFVLMVEAGRIDWAAHDNDAGSTLAELKVLDKTLAVVRDFIQTHPDTLVYINADHDTGLGAFTYQVLSKEQATHKTEQGEVLYDGKNFYGSFDTYALLEKQRQNLYTLENELKKMPPQKLTPQLLQKKLSHAVGYPLNITEFENLEDISGIFKQLNDKYSMVWATKTHSSSMLVGIAYGPYQELFKGVYHNTDILPKMKTALGWSEE